MIRKYWDGHICDYKEIESDMTANNNKFRRCKLCGNAQVLMRGENATENDKWVDVYLPEKSDSD